MLGNLTSQCLDSFDHLIKILGIFILKTDTENTKISCCKLSFLGSEMADSDSVLGAEEPTSDKLGKGVSRAPLIREGGQQLSILRRRYESS